MCEVTRRRAAGPSGALLSFAFAAALAGQTPESTVTLEEAIRLAETRSPVAVAAESGLSAALADRREARGALLPSLLLNGTWGNSNVARVDPVSGLTTSESYGAQIATDYELFGGGRRVAELRAAGAEVGAAGARLREARFETALRTTEIFFAAAAARDLERVASQRHERALQQLEFAQTRLELGTATLSDVLRAEIEVGNAELDLIDARASLRRSTLELGRQVGEAGEVHPAPASLPADAPALESTEALVARALRSAPLLLAASATLDSRRMERLTAYTLYLPSLRLQGGYDWTAADFPPTERSWSVRVVASLPLFDGLVRESSLSRAAAAERTARATAYDAALEVRVVVEAAVHDIVAGGRRVQVSDRSVALAHEDLRVQEERYRIGASTILDLQASQVALADAEAAAVRARQGLGMAVARLEAILGERLAGPLP